MKDSWQGLGSVWGCREVSLPLPLAWAAVRAEERFHCKAQAALMKASPRIQSTVYKGENLLWSPFITRAGQKQTGNRSLWLSLRDWLHKEGDAGFETQRLKRGSHESAGTFSSSPLSPLSFQYTEKCSSSLLPTAASFTWSTQLWVGSVGELKVNWQWSICLSSVPRKLKRFLPSNFNGSRTTAWLTVL